MSNNLLLTPEELAALEQARLDDERKLREDEARAITRNWRGARQRVLTDFSESPLFGGPKQEDLF